MLRRLLFVLGVAAFSYTGFAQAFYQVPAEEAVTLGTLSRNGDYALGNAEGTVFLYNRMAKELTVLEGGYYADGISDNGIYAGNELKVNTVGDKVIETSIPSYIKNGESVSLPLPADTKYTDGTARAVNSDASMFAGYVSLPGDIDRVPCLWTLQPGGSYVAELLPAPEKDFTDRKPQGIDVLLCSDSGNTIVGRMVDWSGMFNILMVWTKKDAQGWEVTELGMDILFKEGSVLPSIPDPEEVNAMDYFTPQDLAAYNKAIEDYEAGLIEDNPEWNKQDYITDPDSIAKYNVAAEEYNAILDIASQKTGELYACLTGKTLDVYSVRLSGNGKFIGTVCSWDDPNGGGDPGPLMCGTRSSDGVFHAPACFDLEKGTWSVKDYIESAVVNGITDGGDIFFATPYQENTRTSFVIPAGTGDVIDVAEWVKQKTNGVVDMKPDFTFSFEYEDYMTGEMVVVTDSLIVGDVTPSANGRVLMGTFYSPVNPEIVTYFVNMDDPSSIKGADADADAVVYPNPATDVIYIKGNVENVTVSDLSGRTVYETSSVSGSIPVDMLNEGVYLVKVKADGKSKTCKIYVK